MFDDIALVIDDKSGKEKIWQKWIGSVNQVFE
jgi:hypothetical protein